MICPDVEKLGKKYKGKLNFSMARCVVRFRSKACGCYRCPVGLSWATKYYILWPMWNKEKEKQNEQSKRT